MLKNSNYQSSSSLKSKCQQLRVQVRRAQLQQYFATKRNEMVFQTQKEIHSTYRMIHQEVNHIEKNPLEIQRIQKKIEQLLKEFPENQYNFIIIGNFIIEVPEKYYAFENYLFSQERLEKTNHELYYWCFGVYLQIFSQMIQKTSFQQQQMKRLQIIQIFFSQLLQNEIKHFELTTQHSNKLEMILIDISMLIYARNKQDFLPITTVKVFTSELYGLYRRIHYQKTLPERNLKIKMSKVFLQIIKQSKVKGLLHLNFGERKHKYFEQNYLQIEKHTLESILKCAGLIFYDNIKNSSQYRVECIISMNHLAQIFPIEAGQYIFQKELIKQLVYLMVNHKSQTMEVILSSFIHIIGSLSNKKISQLIECQFHTNIVECLKKCLQFSFKNIRNSDQMFLIMKCIQIFLEKLAKIDQKLLNNIIQRMCYNNFNGTLERMTTKRFQERIEQVLYNIIDNYFSTDQSYSQNQYSYSNGDLYSSQKMEMCGDNNKEINEEKNNYADQQYLI